MSSFPNGLVKHAFEDLEKMFPGYHSSVPPRRPKERLWDLEPVDERRRGRRSLAFYRVSTNAGVQCCSFHYDYGILT